MMVKALLVVAGLALLVLQRVEARPARAEGVARIEGIASWYGERYRGKPMANGRPFVPEALTCAAWDWPLGTWLVVRAGDKAVRVEVTDRGPARRLHAAGRVVDLSRGAFAVLADPLVGLLEVEVEVAP